jgi:hypothetical protein
LIKVTRLENGLPVEEVTRVEFIVPQEFVCIAVERIGARTRQCIDDTAGRTAVARVVVVRHHGELLNGIGAECQPERTARNAVRIVVQADPVQQIVVLRSVPVQLEMEKAFTY